MNDANAIADGKGATILDHGRRRKSRIARKPSGTTNGNREQTRPIRRHRRQLRAAMHYTSSCVTIRQRMYCTTSHERNLAPTVGQVTPHGTFTGLASQGPTLYPSHEDLDRHAIAAK